MKKNSKVIILHGWSLDANQAQKWQIFRETLKEHNIDSAFLKIPGLSAPLAEIWTLQDYVDWLDQELAAEETVTLLGHSFGGQVAVRYAATHPQKIQALILVDSSGIRDHAFLPTLKRSGFKVIAKIGKLLFPFKIFRQILYTLARERDYQNAPPLLRRTMSQILDDEIVSDLSQIHCPTLLIWGSNDQITPVFLGQVFRSQIPHNQFHLVAGARHSPQYTHPQQVADLIHDFLVQRVEA